MSNPPVPDHVAGTPKGEEQALGAREPGRNPEGKNYRDARDSILLLNIFRCNRHVRK